MGTCNRRVICFRTGDGHRPAKPGRWGRWKGRQLADVQFLQYVMPEEAMRGVVNRDSQARVKSHAAFGSANFAKDCHMKSTDCSTPNRFSARHRLVPAIIVIWCTTVGAPGCSSDSGGTSTAPGAPVIAAAIVDACSSKYSNGTVCYVCRTGREAQDFFPSIGTPFYVGSAGNCGATPGLQNTVTAANLAAAATQEGASSRVITAISNNAGCLRTRGGLCS
jgi:hypothetical protein